MIELTDTQRQALSAEPAQPVEVIDPATLQRYVLLHRDQYERMRTLVEGGPKPVPPLGTQTSAPAAPPQAPLRQRIRDLLLPPEVAAEAKRYCKRLGRWGAQSLRDMEEQMKLQHYYGGRWIACLETDDGLVVVAAAESLGATCFDQQLAAVTAEERRHLLINSPTRLFDSESEILTLFPDES
jgi:hypothetical protein